MELEGNIISGESDSSPIRSIDIRDVLQEPLLNGANADKWKMLTITHSSLLISYDAHDVNLV